MEGSSRPRRHQSGGARRAGCSDRRLVGAGCGCRATAGSDRRRYLRRLVLGSIDGFVGAQGAGALTAPASPLSATLLSLCPRTAATQARACPCWPDRPGTRRARTEAGILETRHRGALSVPRADVEVDVDMENVEDGCYMWGCLVTDRSGATVHRIPGVRDVGAADAGSRDRELARFWRWLMDRPHRRRTTPGRRFALTATTPVPRTPTFVGSGSRPESRTRSGVHRLRRMGRHAEGVGLPADHRRPSGLKVVAPLRDSRGRWMTPVAGSRCRTTSPLATAPTQPRSSGLAAHYNLGDVEATLPIREWVDQDRGSSCRGTGRPVVGRRLSTDLVHTWRRWARKRSK